MPINLRSRRNRVLVGGLDVTPIMIGCEITNSKNNAVGGVIKTAGTLTLSLTTPGWDYAAEALDPRLNPTRWAKGVAVAIEIESSVGILVAHPRGALRILRVPAVPTLGDTQLQISIGCLLTLQDWRQPAGDASGVDVGGLPNQPTSTPQFGRQGVISAIAQKVGLPALLDPISEWPLAAPQPQMGQGYVQQMSDLAAAAGYALWIDNAEQLRATRANFEATHYTLEVASHAQAWSHRESNASPIERFRTHATAKVLKPVKDTGPGRITSVANTRDYAPAEIAETSFSGFSTATLKTNQFIRRAAGIVFPDKPNGQLIIAIVDEQVSYYDGGGNGFLRKQAQTTREPLGKILPDTFKGKFALAIAKQVTTYHSYDGLVTRKIRTETYEPEELVAGLSDLPDPLRLVLSEFQQTEWIKSGDGYIKRDSTGNRKTGETKETVTYSQSGNQPPAPERKQERYSQEEMLLEGRANFPAVGPLYEREQSAEVPTAVSVEQLNWMAQLWGRVVQAQQYPATWAIDMRPEVLENWQPLQVVRWQESATVQGRYLVTGESWSLSQTQAVVACDGMQLSRTITLPGGATAEVPLWPEATTIDGILELFSELDTGAVLPIDSTAIAGILELRSLMRDAAGKSAAMGLLELTGGIPQTVLNFDWIVVDADGNVVTSGGQVISTEGDFSAIVVDAAGNIVTSGGFVVSTEGDFNAIVVDADGNVVTNGGFVVYTG